MQATHGQTEDWQLQLVLKQMHQGSFLSLSASPQML